SSGILLDTTPGSSEFLNLNTSNQMSNSLLSGTYAMTMDDLAGRFTYLYKDQKGKYEVAGMDANESSGNAPKITSPSISPAYVKAGGASATLQAKVTHEGKLNYVIPTVL